MFRLIRLVIFTMLAFVAGVFYERSNTSQACDALGGDMAGGLCITQGGS
ncbi:hypothetical protein [Roseovarius phycicola]|uniref:Uncharacterized protein n=1 Tax=Roseovarius phycicola TaxID=3080976 RepID=A0ABZ2HNL1_9RHOB